MIKKLALAAGFAATALVVSVQPTVGAVSWLW